MKMRWLRQAHNTPVMPKAGLLVLLLRRMATSPSASTPAATRLAYISLTSMVASLSVVLARQQRQEFAPQVGVLQEGAAHHAVGHGGVGVLDAAPVHAE